jgi:hypothetical protein
MRTAVATALALLCLQAPAQGQTQEKISGCVASATGSLYAVRVGDTPASPCLKKDKPISWNIAGPEGPPGPSAVPQYLEVPVDCTTDPPQSINNALATQAERLTVSINGSCTEEVLISRDDVWLHSGGPEARITAPPGSRNAIRIQGAQRVRLQGLMLTGGLFTLEADLGASLSAYSLQISGATGSGFYMGNGVAAYLQDSYITGSQWSGAHMDGGSQLTLWDSHVTDNVSHGIFVQGSSVTLYGTEVARNDAGVGARNGRVVIQPSGNGNSTIHDNRASGIGGGASQFYLSSAQVTGNAYEGLGVADGSAAVLDDVTIEDNGGSGLVVRNGSAVAVGGTGSIKGGPNNPGIRLEDTSTAAVAGSYSIVGSPYGISCPDPRGASVAQLTWPVANTTTNCPVSGQ